MDEYGRIKGKIAKGWNTWNTRSVLSFVCLPEGFAVNLGFKEYRDGNYLKEALIGRFGENDEVIRPGLHAYDGSYTELNLKWRGIEINVQSAADGDDLAILVTPLKNQLIPAVLIAETGILWGLEGSLQMRDGGIAGIFKERKIELFPDGAGVKEPNVQVQTPSFAMSLNKHAGISTGRKRSMDEIEKIILSQKQRQLAVKAKYGGLAEDFIAIQTALAWDTIYEPKKDRVVTPVSRIWNINWGGCVLFCWDSYFAAYMAALNNKELAYSNALEITREITESGFIPNFSGATGIKSRDRSQPPVGSLVIREIYRKYLEKWFLEETFDVLFTWNTWFYEHRQIQQGLLAWGSDPYEPVTGNRWETDGVGNRFGAALESGLDNSPMYDGILFNNEKHCLELADAGLMSLYIMDCNALSDIASVIGKPDCQRELTQRARTVEKGLQTLWSEEDGIYLNRRTDTGEFSRRISPANFYPLLTNVPDREKAERMVREHFYNPGEFWGEWIMPSIARNDPAYPDQDYWRGRIWAPMNFLVYLGFRKHNLIDARRDLAEKSWKLLLKEWLENGHVHENYSADTGEGCGNRKSDKFYHWGALLSFIALMDEGFVEGPEKPL